MPPTKVKPQTIGQVFGPFNFPGVVASGGVRAHGERDANLRSYDDGSGVELYTTAGTGTFRAVDATSGLDIPMEWRGSTLTINSSGYEFLKIEPPAPVLFEGSSYFNREQRDWDVRFSSKNKAKLLVLDAGGDFVSFGTDTQAPSKSILTIEDDAQWSTTGTYQSVGITIKTEAQATGTFSAWFAYQFSPTSALTDITLNMYMDPEVKSWNQYDTTKIGGAIYQQWVDNARVRHQWYTYITGSFHLGAEYDVVPGGQTTFSINQLQGDCDIQFYSTGLDDLLYINSESDEIYMGGKSGLPADQKVILGLQETAPSDVATNEYKEGVGMMAGNLEAGGTPLLSNQYFKFSTPAAGPEAWGAYFGVYGINAYYSPSNNGKWLLNDPARFGAVMDFYTTTHATGTYITFGYLEYDEGPINDWITCYAGIGVGNREVRINHDGLDMNFVVESDNFDPAFFVQGSDGNVGVAHGSPYYNLVVGDGVNVTDPAIGIRSATANLGTLAFGDADSGTARYRGWIEYDHANDDLSLGAEGVEVMVLEAAGVGFFATGDFGGATDAIFIANATSVPASDPIGGGILYVDAGALKYRGSGGTTTTIASA